MKNEKKTLSYLDTWEENKDDLIVWRKFWALWELRRKWKWANWFYNQLDRAGNEVVAPSCWSLTPGEGYMKLCLWIAFLRSVQEGLTIGLDSYDTPNSDKIKITSVFTSVPKEFSNFPVNVPFKNFRNSIFHCQWSPTISKFELDQPTINEVDELHNKVGQWIDKEFWDTFIFFKQKYNAPDYWITDVDGNEWMPETFY